MNGKIDGDIRETVFEHQDGDRHFSITTNERKRINLLRKLTENGAEDTGVQIIAENADGSIFAHVPSNYIRIRKPTVRNISDEERERRRERFRKMIGK